MNIRRLVRRFGGYGFGSLVILMVFGCALARTPIYLDPSFRPMDVQTITVLPAQDSREDHQVQLDETDLQKLVAQVLDRILQEKHYQVTFSSKLLAKQCFETEDSASVAGPCVRTLKSQKATWVLLVFLEDLQKRTASGSGVSAKFSGLLVDTANGKVVWRDFGYKRMGQGGMVGIAMSGLLDTTVLNESVKDLMST
ncbi:MAG: hypothetical protein ACE5NA_09945, partial [Nitrospiraceae bacterium]